MNLNHDAYKYVLDKLFVALLVFDTDGYLNYANEMAKSIFSLQDDDCRSRQMHCSTMSEASWTDILEVLQTGEPQIGKYIRVNNTTMLCNRIPIRKEETVIGVMSSVQYMTEYENTIETLQKDKELPEACPRPSSNHPMTGFT